MSQLRATFFFCSVYPLVSSTPALAAWSDPITLNFTAPGTNVDRQFGIQDFGLLPGNPGWGWTADPASGWQRYMNNRIAEFIAADAGTTPHGGTYYSPSGWQPLAPLRADPSGDFAGRVRYEFETGLLGLAMRLQADQAAGWSNNGNWDGNGTGASIFSTAILGAVTAQFQNATNSGGLPPIGGPVEDFINGNGALGNNFAASPCVGSPLSGTNVACLNQLSNGSSGGSGPDNPFWSAAAPDGNFEFFPDAVFGTFSNDPNDANQYVLNLTFGSFEAFLVETLATPSELTNFGEVMALMGFASPDAVEEFGNLFGDYVQSMSTYGLSVNPQPSAVPLPAPLFLLLGALALLPKRRVRRS